MTVRRRIAATVLALLAAAAVAGMWWFFVTTTTGQTIDEVAYKGSDLGRWRLLESARELLDVVSVPFLMLVVLAGMIVAAVRRRWWLAVAIVVIIAAPNLTTQLLKEALTRPALGISEATMNSFPSGHATVAGSVAVAVLLMVPAPWRWLAALLGGAYATATGVSTLVGAWHRPSDVVSAMLVVAAWTLLALAVLGPAETPVDDDDRRRAGRRPVDDGTGDAEAAAGQADGGSTDRWDGVPERRRPLRRATSATAHLLTAVGVGGLTLALLALLLTGFMGGTSRTELLIAYGGACLGVGAVTCLLFLLLLRMATPRHWR